MTAFNPLARWRVLPRGIVDVADEVVGIPDDQSHISPFADTDDPQTQKRAKSSTAVIDGVVVYKNK